MVTMQRAQVLCGILLSIFMIVGCGGALSDVTGESDEDDDDDVRETLDLTSPTPSAAGCSDGLKSAKEYNLSGDLVYMLDCTYDDEGRLVKGEEFEPEIGSDDLELVISERETLAYDSQGRIAEETTYYDDYSSEDDEEVYLSGIMTFTYDEGTGYLMKTVDESYTLDEDDPTYRVTTEYDDLGRLEKQTTEDLDSEDSEDEVETCEYESSSFYQFTCTTKVGDETTSIEMRDGATETTKTLVDGELVVTDTTSYNPDNLLRLEEYEYKTYDDEGELEEVNTEVCTYEGGERTCNEKTVNADDDVCYTIDSKSKSIGKFRLILGALDVTFTGYGDYERIYDNTQKTGKEVDGSSEYVRPGETVVSYTFDPEKEEPCDYSIESVYDGPGEPDVRDEAYDITMTFKNTYDSEGRLIKRELVEDPEDFEAYYEDDDQFNGDYTYQ